MPSSAEHIAEIVRALRAFYGTPASRTREQNAEEIRVFVQALKDFDPQQLSRAADAWRANHRKMPFPVDLSEIAIGFAAPKPTAAAAPPTPDPLAALRQEVICTITSVDNEARRLFGNGCGIDGALTPAYRAWLDDCGQYLDAIRRDRRPAAYVGELTAYALAGLRLSSPPPWTTDNARTTRGTTSTLSAVPAAG